MGKWIPYLIVGLVIVAMLTHPAGTAAGLTAGGSIITGESAILSGQGQTGGQKGTVMGAGNTFIF